MGKEEELVGGSAYAHRVDVLIANVLDFLPHRREIHRRFDHRRVVRGDQTGRGENGGEEVDVSPLAVPATFFAKAEDGGAPMAHLRRTTMGSVASSSSLSLISSTP